MERRRKERRERRIFKQRPPKQPEYLPKMGEGTEEGNSKISGALEARRQSWCSPLRSHQREQFLDQPGLQLLGEVGTLGAKGAGGGTNGWPLPHGSQRAPVPSLHHPQGRGAFQPFTCDDQVTVTCLGRARLHLPLPLGRLGLWLGAPEDGTELRPGLHTPQKHAHSVRRFIHAKSS